MTNLHIGTICNSNRISGRGSGKNGKTKCNCKAK